VTRAPSNRPVEARVTAAATAGGSAEVEPPPLQKRVVPKPMKLEEMSVMAKKATPIAQEEPAAPEPADEGGGMLERFMGFFRAKPKRPEETARRVEPPRETKQEFAARTALLPRGITPQTYTDKVSVEQEVPHARAAVAQAADLLDKLVQDIRGGRSLEVERVEEIVNGLVESIVRNPDALMWVTRLREQDSSVYGHGLQVSVYLSSFGRHLGFPKQQLAMLAQVGLLLDIGKIRVPKEVLDKPGKLTPAEFEVAKTHVKHSIDILAETPNLEPQVIEAISQHHERLNGSGYPKGLEGDDIVIYGRMAGIADCFSALIKRRPYAEAMSSYEALRTLTGWGGELFQEALVQQFVSSVGVFPVGSLIELSTGEVAIVVAHNKVRRLKPRVLIVTGPDKTPAPHPTMVDLLYDPKLGGDEPAFIKRGLPAGAYGLDLRDFYLA
jgi:HD-GYP domain-containing protein (c-di-GMP phosphodiesterase class II)